jgi:Fe2+ transport system protein B
MFNLLTGSRQKVGNWPEVTVEKKTETCTISGEDVNIVIFQK